MATFQGPLAGIVTALSASASSWNLILACDLPYLTAELIEAVLSRAVRANVQAYVPRTRGGLEPLAAVYRRDAYDKLAEAFREGMRKVTDALARISMETVALEDLGKFDRDGQVLNNMNTPNDLAVAQEWWEAKLGPRREATKALRRLDSAKRPALRPNK